MRECRIVGKRMIYVLMEVLFDRTELIGFHPYIFISMITWLRNT